MSRLAAAAVSLLLASRAFAAAESPLALHTYRADDNGFDVASVLVTGQHDAILIDAQFTRADAHRVVADVLASGKRLRTVYVSQGDPDYYFGLEVIQQAFPDARIVASRATVDNIRSAVAEKMKVWGPKLGANGPSHPVIPEAMDGNRLELEGRTLEILGLDGRSPLYSFVWIPSIKAVVGGVRVFGGMHLWMTDTQTPAARQCWIDDLKRIEALAPAIVIPGHGARDAPQDLSVVRFSEDYLAAYGKALESSHDSTALVTAMKSLYPSLIGEPVLELGAKVNKGEIPWVSAPSCK